MRICIDLDGTLCKNLKDGETYETVAPMEGAVDVVNKLKSKGHYIIIYTARRMKTLNSNIGAIIAEQGPVVINWLAKHNIPYDELLFGKPLADIYIDDKALKFTDWANTLNNL